MRQTKRVTCAGGVIFKRFRGRPKVALVFVKKWKGWGLPKGHKEKKEVVKETAVREVREETGLAGEILRKLGFIRYSYWEEGKRIRKHVHYYLLRYRRGSTRNHDQEVVKVKWMAFPEALRAVKFRNDREIIRKAHSIVRKV